MKIVDKANGVVPFSALVIGSICKISYDEDNRPIYAMKIAPIEDADFNDYNAVDLEEGELLNIATSKKVIPLEVELRIIEEGVL